MKVVGLTGGIGAGKSTVSRLLASHGAVIVDADLIAREVVEPEGPAYQAVVDRFGPSVLLPDGHQSAYGYDATSGTLGFDGVQVPSATPSAEKHSAFMGRSP